MSERLRAIVRRAWPALRLRTVLVAVLLFAGVLPGLSAIFLRVYENTLVRQTEAELVAQSAALAAIVQNRWPGAVAVQPVVQNRSDPDYYRPKPASIDLGSTPVLQARPAAEPTSTPPDPQAQSTAQELDPVMEAVSRTTLASLIMLDQRGAVVRGQEVGGSLAQLAEVQTALAGSPATVLRRNDAYHPRYSMEWLSRASALRIHHARPVLINGQVRAVILASRSPRALFKGMYQDRIKIGLGIVGTLGLLALLAVLVSRGIARPIEALSRATRDVATGGGSLPPAPATAVVEIRALYQDFGRMAEAVERRSRYLRDFAAAVSHEFKTPLSGIQGAVELLQDHDMPIGQQKRFLANIASDARRLSDLVTRLLDLARADMAKAETGLRVDPVVPIAKAVDAYAERLRISMSLEGGAFSVATPASTIEMTVATLLDNCRQAGAASVAIRCEQRDDHLHILIADDGPGVAPADTKRIFEPFFTTRRGEGGAGLGLSIAAALLGANKARIELSPSEKGATFVLILPLASPDEGGGVRSRIAPPS